MNITENIDGNNYIKELISNNHIFSVGRVGLTEIQVSYYYDNNLSIPQHLNNLLVNNAGVYGNSIHSFCSEYIDSIRNSDIQIYWELDNVKQMQNYLYNKYCSSSYITKNRAIEPFYFDNPWSYELRNKKVLIIHPFSDTIKSQYLKKDKIWQNEKILPDFDLITYKNIQSIGGIGPHLTWLKSLNFMKKEISKIDFDIALLGCGAYGMPLCNFIKNDLNKTSIYVGGGLQLLFGIKGNRWDDHDVSKYYNRFWCKPLESEKPTGFKSVEDGCYW